MNFYDVAKDYIERMEYLEQGINAETGEMTENENQLAIWTEELTQDLKDKSVNVIAVVRNQELTIEALDTEIKRLQGMKDNLKKKLERECDVALKQIDEKEYISVLRNAGVERVLKVGVAFFGKEFEVKFEREIK